MKTIDVKMPMGNTITYKLIPCDDGTEMAYEVSTSDEVIRVLEECRKKGTRIRLDYGDAMTGRSFGDVHDITGYIGRSKGTDAYYPILVHNKRSMGGGGIMTQCIIGIKTSAGGRVLYSRGSFERSLQKDI